MTHTLTFEDHLKEKCRHIHHLSVRESKRFNRSKVGRSHRGLSALRRAHASWVDRKVEKYEARAELQPDPAPFFVFTDSTGEFEGDFVEVTNIMPAASQQRDTVVAVEPQFGSQLISTLISANPRLIVAHSQDVRLNLVDEFDELLNCEETTEVFDPREVAGMGYRIKAAKV